MLNKENYVPRSSRLLRYAKSRPNGKLIHNSILNGPYVRKMIPEPGDANREITTILLGLPEDIYAAVDSCETAQEIWLRVQQMMKGYDIRIQEKKAKLFNEWERFTSNEGESIESYYHPDYTQLYDFLKYNQKGVDELKAERLAKTQDPLELMANSNNPYVFPAPHQDQPSFNQNYLQQPMSNPEDITDPTTAMNMTLALMAKAFKLNYSTPTNNNQRISSNPMNRQIAQPRMNMGIPAGYNDVIGNQTQLLIAQKEEAGIQLQAKEYDLMAGAADLDEIEKVTDIIKRTKSKQNRARNGKREKIKSQQKSTQSKSKSKTELRADIAACKNRISLLVKKMGDEEHSTSAWMNFIVVRSSSPYNEIIGRPGVRRIQAVPSTAHGMLKFPVMGGMVALLTDMTGVSRHIAEHRLNIREGCLPIRQKKIGQAPKRNKTIHEKVEKVVNAGLKQSISQRWLSTTENRLEGIVPLRISFQMFPGRIQRIPSNKNGKRRQGKESFITSQGIFCYSKMSFRLKNNGATYQRLVDKAFQKQIDQNLEVYVDDQVIKSRTKQEIIRDIEETFKTLREINMKLNPKKCTFGMREGMFLGYKVNTVGLRKCTKKSDFQWIAEAETAFKQIKKLIAEFPMLTAPKEKEELIIYLAAAKEAIRAVLMTERDEKQVPIYFVSRVLQGPKINYTPMEKPILALSKTSVKGQLLVDFIMEHPVDDPSDTPMEDKEELLDPWILFTDESSCIDYIASIYTTRTVTIEESCWFE
nr:hypothetical protein [Tanacetum cinerariifolium]